MTVHAGAAGGVEARRQPHLLRAWDSSFSAYAQFVSEHGRRPNEHSPSLDERRLALWLRTKRKKVPGPRAEQIAKLDAHFPRWSDARTLESSEQYWLSRYNDYVAFFRENSRLPSTDVAAERALALWVIRQDRARSGGRGLWTPSREAFFAEILRIRLTQKQERASAIAGRWKVRADDLGRFVHEHGRWPRQGSSDPIEHSLAIWLEWQGDRGRVPKQILAGRDRHAYLDKVAPGWRASRRSLTRWKERADELGRFMRDYGRSPQRRAVDPAERSLASWLRYQRTRARGGHANPSGADRHAYLDQVAPGWHAGRRSLVRWKERADELGRFTRNYGRWPQQRAVDAAERSLANWQRNQRRPTLASDRSAHESDRHAYLDEVAPGWNASRMPLVRWEERADELGRFTRNYGRWPQQRAIDPAEQSLAHWRKNQRMLVRKEESRHGTSDRRAYLDEVAPGWSASRWEERADELGCFTRDHGRWPQQRAVDPVERSLANWRKSQRARKESRGVGGVDRHAYLDRVAPGWAGAPRGASVD